NFYAVPNGAETAPPLDVKPGAIITWPSPINTNFPENNTAHVDFFPCARGWTAPTVLMLHALMSASHIGYRRYAARLNQLGWNACLVHLPYHYSRIRRELDRANIDPLLVARHFHLSSPMHNQPLCDAARVLFVAGEFDLIARPEHIEAIQQKWRGSELLRVRQGHFGYRMLRETIAR